MKKKQHKYIIMIDVNADYYWFLKKVDNGHEVTKRAQHATQYDTKAEAVFIINTLKEHREKAKQNAGWGGSSFTSSGVDPDSMMYGGTMKVRRYRP